MRKLLGLIALILSFAGLAEAQSTSVTVTATDAGSVAWANGTYNISFVGNQQNFTWAGGAITTPLTGALNGSASATVSVPDNNRITPGGSQWRVCVTPQAPIPSGSFCSTLTITGATQTVALTPPAIVITVPTTPTVINPVSAYADAEISGGWVGFSYYSLTAGTSRTCSTISGSSCSAWTSGSGGAGASNGFNVITAGQLLNTYGAKFDVTQGSTGTTNSTTVFTDANAHFLNGNAAFNQLPAKVGQIFFATFNCLDSTSSEQFGGLEQTTIASVVSDTQINVVGNASTSTSGTLCYAYGDDDTTAITNAWNAGGCSVSLHMPGGMAFVSAPMFQNQAGCPSSATAAAGYPGPGIFGSNVGTTYLIPLPSFQPSSCTVSCFYGTNVDHIEQHIIWGLGQRCRSTALHPLAVIGQATSAFRWAGVGWGARGCGANNVGVSVQGVTDKFSVGGLNFFGSLGVQVAAKNVTMDNNSVTCNAVAVNSTACIDIAAGATVLSESNSIIGIVAVEGVLTNINDTISSNSGDLCMQISGAGAIINLDWNDTICSNVAGAKPIVMFGTTGARVNVGSNHTFTNGSGQPIFTMVAGDIIDFQGGNNVFTNNGTGYLGGTLGTIISDGRNVSGACTGVGTAASTLALRVSGTATAGTGIPTTCTSTTLDAGQAMTRAGNLQILTVSASAAGTNASSGVVTVLKNGSTTTLTCTIGTGTSCFDGVHTVAFVQGDLISYQFTTQAADTLAGVKAQVTFQ